MNFSRSGRFLVSGTRQYDLLLWSLEDGKLNAVLSGHTRHVWNIDISSDDAFVASGGQDMTLHFWNLNETNYKPGTVSLPGTAYAVAFVASAPVVAVGIGTNGVWLIEIPTGSIIVKMDLPSTSVFRLSATGNWLVHGDDDGNLTCWSTTDLLSERLKTEKGVSMEARKFKSPTSSSVYSLAISSSGAWTAGMYSNGQVYAFGKGTPDVLVGTVAATNSCPVSDDGTGSLACYSESSLAVYKYASWDAEGASRF
ncbi:hypothetical protein FRB99_001770 [Tulasnella sp. 403]|nr:hypothetical protein FRB99_001770 [Tulasnella sp. 403]